LEEYEVNLALINMFMPYMEYLEIIYKTVMQFGSKCSGQEAVCSPRVAGDGIRAIEVSRISDYVSPACRSQAERGFCTR